MCSKCSSFLCCYPGGPLVPSPFITKHGDCGIARWPNLTVMSGLRSTLGLSRTMFTARPIVLSLSTLLVPLLASLYLLTENGARRFETGPRYQNA